MKRITMKLFLITLAVFAVFIGGMLWIQSAFFEDYYIQKKTALVKQAAGYLTQYYAEVDDPFETEALQAVAKYTADFGLSSFFIQDTDHDSASTSGFINGPVQAYQQEFLTNLIASSKARYEREKPFVDSGGVLEYRMQDIYGNTMICTVTRVEGDAAGGILYLFASLQPVGEAAEVIKDYYILFFFAALALLGMLSILYSRQITKPIIHISQIAGQIAEQNFSEACTYRSNDELGHLAETVNTLSVNLSGAIRRLEDANKRLTSELARSRELEQQRQAFVADVSHELKTPLSVMRGYLEKLQDAQLDSAGITEAADIMIGESERMDRLISGMLVLSSYEAGAVKLDFASVSIERMVRYILKKKADELEQKQLAFRFVAEDGLLARCDAFRMEQVLLNLINNAVQYTPNGGIIRIRLLQKGEELRCELENELAHVPEAELANVWNHFYRVEKSRNKKYGGVGLGLAIVRQILELHKSCYGMENTQRGVLVWFTLPIAQDENSGDTCVPNAG